MNSVCLNEKSRWLNKRGVDRCKLDEKSSEIVEEKRLNKGVIELKGASPYFEKNSQFF